MKGTVRFERFTNNPRTPAVPLVDLRIGATIKQAGPGLLRAIADTLRGSSGDGIRVRRLGGPSRNPTLVHHGKATAAKYHVLFGTGHPAADVYGLTAAQAAAVGQAIADMTGSSVKLLQNENLPHSLDQHDLLTYRQPDFTTRRSNPAEPVKGQLWGRLRGGTSRVLEIAPPRIQVLDMHAGTREWLMLSEFYATHQAPRRRNPSRSIRAANPKRRNARAKGSDWCAIDARGSYFWEGRGTLTRAQAEREAAAVTSEQLGRPIQYPIRVLRVSERAAEMAARPLPKRRNPAPYKLTWQRYSAGPRSRPGDGMRASTGIGDYYVTKQRDEAKRVVGITVQLNTYAKNAQGWHWTDLGHAMTMREAKAKAAADWAQRGEAPAANPKRRTRSNPRPFASERQRAEKMFETWHEFPAETVKRVQVPSRTIPKHVVGLGKVVRIDYISNKWEGNPVTYTHSTKRPHPELVSDPDGRQLYLVGGRMKPTADGLVN